MLSQTYYRMPRSRKGNLVALKGGGLQHFQLTIEACARICCALKRVLVPFLPSFFRGLGSVYLLMHSLRKELAIIHVLTGSF